MRVFITGATGWVGSALVPELLAHGHRVHALVRSSSKAEALTVAGVEAVHGTLDDLEILGHAARAADAVVHLAFDHNWTRFVASAAQEASAIRAMGEALTETGKRLLVSSGLTHVAPGRVATEGDVAPEGPSVLRKSEILARAFAENGVRATTVRLAPSVHGVGERHGLVPLLMALARDKGVSAYIGAGLNRWPAVHRADVARLYRLALESEVTSLAYHAVAEPSIPFRHIAEAIGHRLGLPVEARGPEHFGWLAGFASADIPAQSVGTRAVLGWAPKGPDLLTDLGAHGYAADSRLPP